MFALMDTLGVGKAHVAGYSYGGLMGLHAALARPERIGKIAVIDAPSLMEKEIGSLTRQSDVWMDDNPFLEYTRSVGIVVSEKRMNDQIELVEYLLKEGRVKECLEADRRFLADAPLEQISQPVLLLYGNHSPYLEAARLQRRRIPNASLRIGRGDHNLPVQRGWWVRTHLNFFFARKARPHAIPWLP
jgi:pimeloyl-ACP methyl ester carboxylesterase